MEGKIERLAKIAVWIWQWGKEAISILLLRSQSGLISGSDFFFFLNKKNHTKKDKVLRNSIIVKNSVKWLWNWESENSYRILEWRFSVVLSWPEGGLFWLNHIATAGFDGWWWNLWDFHCLLSSLLAYQHLPKSMQEATNLYLLLR